METENQDEFEKIESEEEDNQIDTSPYDIVTYGADYTISVLYDKLEKNEIIIPEFQRKYVWKLEQASKLIESFLLGLPVPGIFLAKEINTNNLIVVDGQQRLVTIRAFINNKFPITEQPFKLKDVKDKWKNKTYLDLDASDRKSFDDSILRATIIKQISPQDNTSIYHIFERLNTGGTSLQSQEIRNCVYHGKFNNLLHELNELPKWRRLYGKEESHIRMKDQELILRFLALHYNSEIYKKPMNEFLSKFMNDNKNSSDEKLEEYRKLFEKTISFVHDKIGWEAFRPNVVINVSAFDTIMFVVSKYLDKLRPDLKEQLRNLFSDEEFKYLISVRTTDEENVKKRLELAKKYFLVLNDK